MADIKNNLKIDEHTVFEWGSTSKILVYISIMQLVEQNKLSLDEDIRTYLPEGFLKKRKSDDKITLLNLMHHNAGWSDNIRDMMYEDEGDIIEFGKQLQLYEPEQVFSVGEGVGYSNFGIGLAGYIIECVSGEPYYVYVEKHILNKLDMQDTNIFYGRSGNKEVDKKRDQVKGYGSLLKEKKRLYVAIYPAGSVIGTMDDMVKLVKALNPNAKEESPLFQKQETLTRLLETSYRVREDLPGIAHGLFEKSYQTDTVGHSGHTNAFSAEIAFSPESGTAFLVLSNQDHERAMCQELEGLIFGMKKLNNRQEELPDAHEVEGYYMNYRSFFSGFEKWLSSPIEIVAIDSSHIQYLNYKAEQIQAYTYRFINDEGIEKQLFFERDGNKIVKMALVSDKEFFPVSKTLPGIRKFVLGLTVAIALFFIIGVWIMFVYYIRRIRKGRKDQKNKETRVQSILLIMGVSSLVNTVWLYILAASFTSSKALQLHFIYQWIYLLTVAVLTVMKITDIVKKRSSRRWTMVVYGVSILWCILLIACEWIH